MKAEREKNVALQIRKIVWQCFHQNNRARSWPTQAMSFWRQQKWRRRLKIKSLYTIWQRSRIEGQSVWVSVTSRTFCTIDEISFTNKAFVILGPMYFVKFDDDWQLCWWRIFASEIQLKTCFPRLTFQLWCHIFFYKMERADRSTLPDEGIRKHWKK